VYGLLMRLSAVFVLWIWHRSGTGRALFWVDRPMLLVVARFNNDSYGEVCKSRAAPGVRIHSSPANRHKLSVRFAEMSEKAGSSRDFALCGRFPD
jgi:hypothetical protein